MWRDSGSLALPTSERPSDVKLPSSTGAFPARPIGDCGEFFTARVMDVNGGLQHDFPMLCVRVGARTRRTERRAARNSTTESSLRLRDAIHATYFVMLFW
jgi:hypothetical protein